LFNPLVWSKSVKDFEFFFFLEWHVFSILLLFSYKPMYICMWKYAVSRRQEEHWNGWRLTGPHQNSFVFLKTKRWLLNPHRVTC